MALGCGYVSVRLCLGPLLLCVAMVCVRIGLRGLSFSCQLQPSKASVQLEERLHEAWGLLKAFNEPAV